MQPVPAAPTTRVAICVCTCLRPAGIARALESLAGLVFRTSAGVAPEVIVVDNDAAGSAQAVVERAAARMPWPTRYAIEPRRGISFARNRAVALAEGCDFVAFVDDDEIVEPGWLDELIAAQRRFDADVVAGPALPLFESEPPAWLLRGRFVGVPRFDRARRPTGTPLPHASTANVLLRRELLRRMAGPFHPAFATSGGSDILLTMQLARLGARLVWCDEAVVSEFIPASRARAAWIVRRAYRVGMIVSRCERELEPSPRRLAGRALRGGFCVALGVGGLLPALVGGRATAVRMLSYAARGAGIFAGLAGAHFEEYRVIHGS